MSGYYHIVRQFHLEGGVRQRLYDHAFKLDNVILRQNNPSYLAFASYDLKNSRAARHSTLVRHSGPLSVIATVCS